MASGTLIGPYARQVTGTKLKFWLVQVFEDGSRSRYEVSIDTFDKRVKARHRPIFKGKVPSHSSNFNDYLIPDDLDLFPSALFPRFYNDKIADAALTLLRGQDIADVTRVRMIGILPEPAKHGANGDLL
jgi:hypothetical protein